MSRRAVLEIGSVIGLAITGVILAANDGARPSGDRSVAGPIRFVGTLLVQMRVSNLDRAVHFYHEVLGFKVKERIDELHWAKLDPGIPGVTIGLGEGPEVKGSGSVSLNLGVADIDAARETLTKRGVTFKGETMTIPGKVRLAEFEDPDGNRIRLAQGLTEP